MTIRQGSIPCHYHAMIAKFLLILAFCAFAAEVIALLIYKTNDNDY